MPTPAPRTPICIARGNLVDLEANKGDLEEGEICWAFDVNMHYMKKGNDLIQVTRDPTPWDDIPNLPPANDFEVMQAIGGKWRGSDQLNGGNF